MFTCHLCNKQYKHKHNLKNHHKGYNKCGFEIMMSEKDKQIETLKLQVDSLIEELKNKPITINYNTDNSVRVEKIECNMTQKQYFNNVDGFSLTYDFIESRKYEKLQSIVDNTVKSNFKGLTYWYILTQFCKEKEIIDSVLIRDANRGSLDVKYNNLVDRFTKLYHHEHLDYEMKRVWNEINNITRSNYPNKLKFLKDHKYHMNKLRLRMNKEGEKMGCEWKSKKDDMLCIQSN